MWLSIAFVCLFVLVSERVCVCLVQKRAVSPPRAVSVTAAQRRALHLHRDTAAMEAPRNGANKLISNARLGLGASSMKALH